MRAAVAVVLVLAGCGRIGFGELVGDATPGCEAPLTWFADRDGDGHGDAAITIAACVQPANTAASNDDCDDQDRYRYPGAPEVCDGQDSDCNAVTLETCAADCVLARRPAPNDAHLYLSCFDNRPWATARTNCSKDGYYLAQINDAAENTWVRARGDTLTYAAIYLGGNDLAAEGSWEWLDGDPFWQGDNTGMEIGGGYAAWGPAEPNNVTDEDCLTMIFDGTWNDVACGDPTQYFCERD